MQRRAAGRIVLTAALFAMSAQAGVSQQAPADSINLVVGAEHARPIGWVFLAGEGWRAAWTAPVRLPRFEPGRFEGGMVRFEQDTTGLSDVLKGWTADGRAWRIRPVNRLAVNPVVPLAAEGEVIVRFFQDLVSTEHPAAPAIAAALYRAAGLEAADPVMMALPGAGVPEPLASAAGEAVWVERAAEWDHQPTGALAAVITTDSLLALRRKDPSIQVDVAGYLAARLLDILMGDPYRDGRNWRWGRGPQAGGDQPWRPIGVRHEAAFVRPDGLDARLFQAFLAALVGFSDKVPNVLRLTLQGYDLDRPLLVALERSAWDSVAAELSERLSDAAIRQAVATMPAGMAQVSGAILVETLAARREHLAAVVDAYFEIVNRYADVELSDAAEQVTLARTEGGDLDLVVRVSGGPQIFHRHFSLNETDELRLHLGAAGDTVRLDHMDRHGIGVRITGGPGDDLVERSGAGAVHRVVVYDAAGAVTIVPEGEIRVVPRAIERYRLWTDRGAQPRHRDWGVDRSPVLALDITGDLGFLIGGGLQWRWYSFGEPVYRQRLQTSIEYATRPNNGRLRADWERRNIFRNIHLALGGKISGIEVVRFFGYGNDTEFSGDLDDYRTDSREWSARAMIGVGRTPELQVRFGPVAYTSNSDTTGFGIVGDTNPYGAGHFRMIGLEADFNYTPARGRYQGGLGLQLTARGQFFPQIFDVDQGAFGGISSEARLVWIPSDGSRWAVASRVGGSVLSGTVPYTRATRLGGGGSLRGFDTGRFTGDQGSAYGSLEGRLRFARLQLGLAPSDIGTFVFGDLGRVWTSGESSSTVHFGSGIGLWIAPSIYWLPGLSGLIARVHYAWAGERKTINVGTGFQF